MNTDEIPAGESPAVSVTDRLLLGMLMGLSAERAARKAGVLEADIPAAVKEAKRRLTVAADYNRDEQLGTSINRLNDLYTRAMSGGDFKSCVVIQKELNRLMDLYRPTTRHAVDNSGRIEVELAATRGHLVPMQLADPNTATDELARLAVAEIVALRNAR